MRAYESHEVSPDPLDERFFAEARRYYVFSGKARIIERRLIGVNRSAGGILNDNCLRYRVCDPAEFAFFFTQFFFGLLETSMSVLVPYQRKSLPVSSRNGSTRIKNQRYTPSWRRRRASISPGSPDVNSSRHRSINGGKSSG